MNSIFILQDAIRHIIKENKEKKYFFLFNKWNDIAFHNGEKYRVKIEKIESEGE